MLGYVLLLVACLAISVIAGMTPFAGQIDNDAYDYLFRLRPAGQPPLEAAILAVDDASLVRMRGMHVGFRPALTRVLEILSQWPPRVLAVDAQLADEHTSAEDAPLEAALAKTTNLVLACDLVPGGWQDPAPRFRKWAAAVGHVHAAPDEHDSLTRELPLEKAAGRDRRWAMALEAYRLSRNAGPVVESPADLLIGGLRVPAERSDSRALRIRFLPPGPAPNAIPRVTFEEIESDPARARLLAGKVVFVGVTAQTEARDRLLTPASTTLPMSGVEIHANAYETLVRGQFLVSMSDSVVLAFCLAIAVVAGLIFSLRSGWQSYSLGALLLAAVHVAPWVAFGRGQVMPYFAPVSTAWLSIAGCASYQHFVVRRQLRRAESERARYQQAIHFVTHEMRTPLTTIQGSSEIMTRYALPDDKRKQIAQMINTESKRLAKLIQTFLDVERLSEGQMELKRETFPTPAVVEACVDRARPLAERKRIGLHLRDVPGALLLGDRELMEYAVYNLLTNAIKYSPAGTEVEIAGRLESDQLLLSIKDQGIGMDSNELSRVFQKFYRTKKAEASGEVGTGIGLSIVQQIVTHHGGRIEATSAPGKGSCFTLVLPASVPSAAGAD
jgi:signal transduction histidine kinase